MTTTLQVIEATFKEHGYTYSRWQVTGYVNGKRVRFRAKNKQHAQLIKIREETKGVNAGCGLAYLPTHLTKVQLDETEAVFEKLGNVATLTKAERRVPLAGRTLLLRDLVHHELVRNTAQRCALPHRLEAAGLEDR